jgi:hypothetical protein
LARTEIAAQVQPKRHHPIPTGYLSCPKADRVSHFEFKPRRAHLMTLNKANERGVVIQSFGVDHPFLLCKVHTITPRFAVGHRWTRQECLCTLAREVIFWSVSDEVLWWERVSGSCEMFSGVMGLRKGGGSKAEQ